jgi:hypothetical protein
VFAILSISLGFGQTVKLHAGTSISRLYWDVGNYDIQYFNKSLVGYSVFLGLDFGKKKYYNLSSNIGVLSKGGKAVINYELDDPSDPVFMGEKGRTEIAKLNYLSINTLIDLKYPLKQKLTPYLSVGPRFDLLTSSSSQFESQKESNNLNKLSFGFLLGAGIKRQISKVEIGLKTDYYLNLNKVLSSNGDDNSLAVRVQDRTITTNLTIGYKLK